MPLYEYQCEECGEVSEGRAKIADRLIPIVCSHCGGKAHFIVSACRFVLEGCSGDYPTAADQWVKKRKQKQNQERKANGLPPLK